MFTQQVEASKGLKAELCTALWLENWAGCGNTLREQGNNPPTNPIAGTGIHTVMGEGNKEQLIVILLIVTADKNGWRRASSQGER